MIGGIKAEDPHQSARRELPKEAAKWHCMHLKRPPRNQSRTTFFADEASQTWVRSESGLFPFLRLDDGPNLDRLYEYDRPLRKGRKPVVRCVNR